MIDEGVVYRIAIGNDGLKKGFRFQLINNHILLLEKGIFTIEEFDSISGGTTFEIDYDYYSGEIERHKNAIKGIKKLIKKYQK